MDVSRSATPRRLSAEIFSIPLENGRYLVYAPLRRAAFVANAQMVNVLADLQNGSFDRRLDPDGSVVELLRQLELVDGDPERAPLHAFSGDPRPTAVTLFLTTACNLRCSYCYATAGDTARRFMPLEVARRGIDFVADNALARGLSRFEVAYHGGGEPTVNWRTLTGSFTYARERARQSGIELQSAMATNGVLNDRQIDWITDHLDGASVSFDGLPAVHDKHRILRNGSGSSARVMHALQRFEAARFPYGMRVTVTQDQIPSLPESIEFICRHFHPERIQVEPVYQLGRWSDAASAETNAFIDAYREAQQRARRHGREISFSAARLDTLTNHFCAVSQDNFCLTPDGNVSACYEAFAEGSRWASVFFYGTPDAQEGYRLDLLALDRLRRLGVEHRPHCQGCFAKWHCAGDCYYKALAVSEGKEFAGSGRCHITCELTTDQILERIAASGGLFWHASLNDPAVRPAPR